MTEQLPAPTPRKPWYKRKAVIIPTAVVAGLVIIGLLASNGQNDPGADAAAPADASTTATETPAAAPAEPATVTVPDLGDMTVADARTAVEGENLVFGLNAKSSGAGDDWIVDSQSSEPGDELNKGAKITVVAHKPLTLEQQNALQSAKQYLDMTGFSRQGLIEQLSSSAGSGYPKSVATWAADHAGADWNQEAVESAKSYLELTSFSRDGLYEQLTSSAGSGYTPSQANYALRQVGY